MHKQVPLLMDQELILLPLCCAVRFDTTHIKRIWYDRYRYSSRSC